MDWRRWQARVRRASGSDLLFVVRAGATATIAAGLLRKVSLPWAVRLTCWRGPLRLGIPVEARLIALVDRLLALDRGPLRPNCLLRSLVLLRYLGGGDDAVVLKVGIRPGVRPVDGHAWLESEGEPVAERTDPRTAYLVTWSWPR